MAKKLKKVSGSYIVSASDCRAKAFYDSLGFISFKGKAYQKAIAIKEIIKTIPFDKVPEKKFYDFLSKKLSDDFFLSPETKEEELMLLSKQLERYYEYESKLERTVLTTNVDARFAFGDYEISVSADAVIQSGDTIEVIKYKQSAPKLSYRGQKEDTIVAKSVELYLLYLLGKHLYPNASSVSGALYHLKSKRDKSSEFAVFDLKKGDNIVACDFGAWEVNTVEYLNNKVISIASEELSLTTACKSKSDSCDICTYKNVCHYEKSSDLNIEEIESPIVKAGSNFALMPNQYEAVMFDEGIARLNAGAGAGKTTVIAIRVVELISKGVSPKKILLITFSNKGAQEMREKIKFWLGVNGLGDVNIDDMHIMTFNCWGDMVISKNYKELGFDKKPILAEKIERYDIIFETLRQLKKIDGCNYRNPLLDFPNAKGVVVEMNEYFDYIKGNYIMDSATFAQRKKISDVKAMEVFEAYNLFNELLVKKGYIQYQDQINMLIRLLEENPDIFDKYAYEHIMVDEYQDTDSMQVDIIGALSGNPCFESLMVVGDDSQAIFGFRNCSPKGLINFHKIFDNVKDFYLLDNFRSTPEILAVANYINSLNKNRILKDLVSHAPAGDVPVVASFNTSEDEIGYIVDTIKQELALGTPIEDIAIITRNRSELFNLQAILTEENIPCLVDVPEPILNNKNLHILISFVEFFENPNTSYSLFEYLYSLKNDEFEAMTNDEIVNYVESAKSRFLAKLNSLSTEESRIDFFFQSAYSLAKEDETLSSFISGLKDKGFSQLSDMFNYLRKIIAYEETEKTIEKDETKKYKAVTLITAHTSKGKEYGVVINSINKYYKDGLTEDEVEETRRLLFVSFTRAKQRLYITGMKRINKKIGIYNPFLKEILMGPVRTYENHGLAI